MARTEERVAVCRDGDHDHDGGGGGGGGGDIPRARGVVASFGAVCILRRFMEL